MSCIVVTGASRGIGAATAIMAAREGYAVCVNYHTNACAAERVVEQIVENGGRAAPMAADVSNEQEVAAMFAQAESTLGPLRALVNNAAILETQCDFTAIDPDRFRRIIETNVLGAFNCMQESIRRMSSANGGDGGVIVNVSSIAARTGAPHEYVDYAASKGAVDAMSAGAAREAAAEGVRINLVRPGLIYTEMHAAGGEPDRVNRLVPSIPLGRGGEPEDVAKAITWLLSDKARYVVGATLDVTGGI